MTSTTILKARKMKAGTTDPATEPFLEFQKLDRGIPSLKTWTNRKTMHVHWGDGSLRDYVEFSAVLDGHAMQAELLELWHRSKPQCGPRAQFSYGDGGPHGCMVYLPIEAGIVATAIVRRYFTEALEAVAAGIARAEELGIGLWHLHWNREAKGWEAESAVPAAGHGLDRPGCKETSP
jgi:hypothetical protein